MGLFGKTSIATTQKSYCNIWGSSIATSQKTIATRRKQMRRWVRDTDCSSPLPHLRAHRREEGKTLELAESTDGGGGGWLRSRKGGGLRSRGSTYLIGAAAVILIFVGDRGGSEGGRKGGAGAATWRVSTTACRIARGGSIVGTGGAGGGSR